MQLLIPVLPISQQSAEADAAPPPATHGPSQRRSTSSPDVPSPAIEKIRPRKTPTSEEGVLETVSRQTVLINICC